MAITGTTTEGNDVISSDGASDVLNGAGGNDVLDANGGNDTLDGGTGIDTMLGGDGNDLFYVDNTADDVREITDTVGGASGTLDAVITTVNYTLALDQQIEFLYAAGPGAAAGTGTPAAGLPQTRTAGDVTLTGNNLANNIFGNAGNNVLDGGLQPSGNALTNLNDTLVGGLGNDTYIVRDASDVVTELANEGTDTVSLVINPAANQVPNNLGAAYTAPTNVENVQISDATTTTAFALTGNAVANLLTGNAGANTFNNGTANPNANTAAATIFDTFVGLGGNDLYQVNQTGTVVVEAASGGRDRVDVGTNTDVVAYTLNANSEVEIISINAGVTAGSNVVGNETSQGIIALNTAGNFADTLNGGTGADTLVGSTGSDTYFVDSLTDVVVEGTQANGGTDIVFASSSYFIRQTLTAAENTVLDTDGTTQLITAANSGVAGGAATAAANSIEVLAAAGFATVNPFSSTTNINTLNTTVTSNYFVGNTASQTIFGDAGGNIIDGYRTAGVFTLTTAAIQANGADLLIGGAGNDTYRVYDQTDVVVETNGGGAFDFIYTDANYSLATNDTNVAAIGTDARSGINLASFGAGNAVQQVEVLSAANQSGVAAGGTLTLTGNAYANIVIGDYGNNVLDGGGTTAGGANGVAVDQLTGLRGDDTYIARTRLTTVNENVGEGRDNLQLNFTDATETAYAINGATEVEVIELNAASANQSLSIQGNEFAQVILGGTGANALNGLGGADTLVGRAGNDVYNIFSGTEIIVENAGEGTDTVFTNISYNLAAVGTYTGANNVFVPNGGVEVENLIAANGAGTTAINLTGNGTAQNIVGNYGNNVLDGDDDGGAGVDTLTGLLGDDTYIVRHTGDVIRENAGEGNDAVLAAVSYQLRTGNSVEVLSTTNNTGNVQGINLTGNDLTNTIVGNGGNQQIAGREGNDTLTGGGGDDVFLFDTALNATTNVDTILDFSPGDRIGLSNAAAGPFAALGATFDTNEFVNGTTATAANAQILYDQNNGNIFYDADGTGAGAAILFAKITAGTILGTNDFFMTAPTAALAAA